ncbi:DUF4167 domain-containing protein [Paracoccus spongiarum]|uniref:DUF4167 domain-containing protein n=1 Tax=Paracoccus spongiarum TaxID=3064387 RepID=A0ABT9JAP8_9RHOB|nr:DUF4167 domain-containing protein [Paracoccus sp. 2205BS29-5]MDP5306880.1 DUF4167 domain-containing protein [Paracoccus sp. 2205BS29-5]
MRSSKSRSRNKSNRQRTLGNIVNRVFDSSGPEGKVRGTPQQIIEKYLTLARDAQLSNDRVAEQSFLQHAEHYTRMLGEAQREMAERQQHGQHPQNSQRQPGEDEAGPRRDQNHQGGHSGQNGQHPRGRDADRRGEDEPQAARGGPAEAEPQPAETREARPAQDASQAAAGDDRPAGLPDAVGDAAEDAADLVATPESEAKPARSRSPRSKAPRSAEPGRAAPRSRRKPPAEAEGGADGSQGADSVSGEG